jgi:hypothetical protein
MDPSAYTQLRSLSEDREVSGATSNGNGSGPHHAPPQVIPGRGTHSLDMGSMELAAGRANGFSGEGKNGEWVSMCLLLCLPSHPVIA